MEESQYINKNKSTMLLIAAILLAVAVTLWIILSFDDQTGNQDNIGHAKIKPIMVSDTNLNDLPSNHIL